MNECNVPLLAPETIRHAVQIYVARAYSAVTPAAVRRRIEDLLAAADEQFYQSSMFERSACDASGAVQTYALRLGNQFYPHMKLRIDCAPDRSGYLLKADTHDRHCCPAPTSREFAAFKELMEQNQKLAQEIELAWAEAGLPTFKTYLRRDLARRQAKQ